MADWETVRALAAELLEVEESTSYGTPALKVRGKMFARLREDGETLVVWTDYIEREALTQGEPETFFITPHYEDYPLVLISLQRVDEAELRELLIESWRERAPKRLLGEVRRQVYVITLIERSPRTGCPPLRLAAPGDAGLPHW